VRAFVEAFNAGDVSRMEALCTGDAEVAGLRVALEDTRYVGPEAVRRFWTDAINVWEELHLEIEQIHSRGDTVIVRAMWHGRGHGSGVHVERQLGFRFRLERGRIASARTYVNPEEAD
jgi:ketosteroid isomerase-like protein